MTSPALAITPASGAITATQTICRVNVTDAPANTMTGYEGDGTQYPAAPEVRYYLAFIDSNDVEAGRSYIFGTNEDGEHVFNNYIFPYADTWSVSLRDSADDGEVVAISVVVAAVA